MTGPSTRSVNARRRDLLVASACGGFVALMLGLSYAAVPLYDWFCRATGFAGTTQVATAPPAQVLNRSITVRFDTNVSGGLPWTFEPERRSISARLGEVVTVEYTVVNRSARTTVGMATFNVVPLNLGAYFQKINCFCFTDQQLAPGERRQMTVVFYVDPELAKDDDARALDAMTLSYTMVPVAQPDKPVAESARPGAAGRL